MLAVVRLKRRRKEAGQYADEIIGIFNAGRFITGMHGQLCEADIDGVQRNVRIGDGAER